MKKHPNDIFENLFVLEMANNHWGDVDRGLSIIRAFGEVVRKHNVKAALKLQFRDVHNFVHPKFVCDDERYIKKTLQTGMSLDQFRILSSAIVDEGCIPMATPFDETSVDWCVDLGYQLIKVASSDINDRPLLEKIASTGKPVIVSSGGASEEEIDNVVAFFDQKNIPICINHCVSIYPSEDDQLELNQIDYLMRRFPSKVIGFSTHEYTDWSSSLLISYAKGARSWERHIDIDDGTAAVSQYCSLPLQIDEWFSAFKTAKKMCGSSSLVRRSIGKQEIKYLDNMVRGVYAKTDIPEGLRVTEGNFDKFFAFAIPLQQGQLSCREEIFGAVIKHNLAAGSEVSVADIQNIQELPEVDPVKIYNRGREVLSTCDPDIINDISQKSGQLGTCKLHLDRS